MNETAASKLIWNALPFRPGGASSSEEISPLQGGLEVDHILPSGKVVYKGNVTEAGEGMSDERGKGKPRLNVHEVMKKYHLYVKIA